MIKCSWCGAAMWEVAPVETGLFLGFAEVWLCSNQACGHELEVIRVKPLVVHDTSIGYGRSVISATSGKFANFLIEVDSTDYKAKTEALKACSESETAVHPGDW